MTKIEVTVCEKPVSLLRRGTYADRLVRLYELLSWVADRAKRDPIYLDENEIAEIIGWDTDVPGYQYHIRETCKRLVRRGLLESIQTTHLNDPVTTYIVCEAEQSAQGAKILRRIGAAKVIEVER